MEADSNTARVAHKASFWLVDKESRSNLRKWLTIERATSTPESLEGHTEDWGGGGGGGGVGKEWSGLKKTSPKINLSLPLFEKPISAKLGEMENTRQGKMKNVKER